MKKHVVVPFVLFVLVVLFAVTSVMAEDVPPIKIGVIYALTGPSAARASIKKQRLNLALIL